MSQPSWTDVMQAVTAVVQAVVAGGSLLVTGTGIWFLVRQLRQVDRTIQADTNANLCGQSIEILNALADCPESYACFYDDAPLPTDHQTRVRVLCVCEMIANYMDHVCQQKDNLSAEAWERWQAFVHDTVTSSQVVQDHLCRFERWYTPELLDIVRVFCKRPPTAAASNLPADEPQRAAAGGHADRVSDRDPPAADHPGPKAASARERPGDAGHR